MTVRLRLFGPPQLLVDGADVTPPDWPARRLLLLLALERGTVVADRALVDVMRSGAAADAATVTAGVEALVARLGVMSGVTVLAGGGWRLDAFGPLTDLDVLEDDVRTTPPDEAFDRLRVAAQTVGVEPLQGLLGDVFARHRTAVGRRAASVLAAFASAVPPGADRAEVPKLLEPFTWRHSGSAPLWEQYLTALVDHPGSADVLAEFRRADTELRAAGGLPPDLVALRRYVASGPSSGPPGATRHVARPGPGPGRPVAGRSSVPPVVPVTGRLPLPGGVAPPGLGFEVLAGFEVSVGPLRALGPWDDDMRRLLTVLVLHHGLAVPDQVAAAAVWGDPGRTRFVGPLADALDMKLRLLRKAPA